MDRVHARWDAAIRTVASTPPSTEESRKENIMSFTEVATFWDALAKKHGTYNLDHRYVDGLDSVSVRETFSGPAYTIRMRRAPDYSDDNRKRVLQAFDEIPRGAVLVAEMVELWGATLGDVIAHRLAIVGVAGIVTGGVIRDVATIEALKIPLLYRGLTMSAQSNNGVLVEVGQSVSIDNVTIRSGDMVVGNRDGFVVVDQEEYPAIEAMANEKSTDEESWHRKIASGKSLVEVFF